MRFGLTYDGKSLTISVVFKNLLQNVLAYSSLKCVLCFPSSLPWRFAFKNLIFFRAGALVYWQREETPVKRLWVWIPAPDPAWAFFIIICCKTCIVYLKWPKINEKDAGDGPLKMYFRFNRSMAVWGLGDSRINKQIHQAFQVKHHFANIGISKLAI